MKTFFSILITLHIYGIHVTTLHLTSALLLIKSSDELHQIHFMRKSMDRRPQVSNDPKVQINL